MTDNSSFSSSSSSSSSSTPLSSPVARKPLVKQRSWSTNLSREEAWLRRKGIHQDRRRQVDGTLKRSVTDEDLDELRGCIDLGFGFDFDSGLSESDSSSSRSLADTFPALDLYYAVNREYSDAVSGVRSSSTSGSDSLQAASSPLSIYSPGIKLTRFFRESRRDHMFRSRYLGDCGFKNLKNVARSY